MTFDIWPTLTESRYQDLITAVTQIDDPTNASVITSLRKTWPNHLVHGAVQLVVARRKAAVKFPHSEQLVADPAGVEQATSSDVAIHKARRFEASGMGHVLDLCCGIGGDAMALGDVSTLTLVDMNPSRVWMARHNVLCVTNRRGVAVAADVTTLRLPATPFHIDPARRTVTGRRMHRLDDSQPGAPFVQKLIDHAKDGAVKLSPGIDFDSLPSGEVEIINRNGTLVQAVLWAGRLSNDDELRTATRLPEGITFTATPHLPVPCIPPERYLFAVDPAVERADLIGALCQHLNLAAVHPALGLLTSVDMISNEWLTPFELIEAMPWREKKVKVWLTAHDAGEVIVKTRDKTVDPDIVSRRLRGTGNRIFTVFILRLEKKVVAWVTKRIG